MATGTVSIDSLDQIIQLGAQVNQQAIALKASVQQLQAAMGPVGSAPVPPTKKSAGSKSSGAKSSSGSNGQASARKGGRGRRSDGNPGLAEVLVGYLETPMTAGAIKKKIAETGDWTTDKNADQQISSNLYLLKKRGVLKLDKESGEYSLA